MAERVATVWLPVQDMDRAVAFYQDKLGFDVAFSSPEWSELKLGGFTVGLNGRKSEAGGVGVDGGAVISLAPDGDDLDREVEQLSQQGVEFIGGISDHDWGRVAPFKDSEGNNLQFYAPPVG